MFGSLLIMKRKERDRKESRMAYGRMWWRVNMDYLG
jgi:hypothetical protein